MKNEFILGQDITKLDTIGSMYDNGCINVYVGDELFKLDIQQILAFNTDFNSIKFKVNKKIKHKYLEVIKDEINIKNNIL